MSGRSAASAARTLKAASPKTSTEPASRNRVGRKLPYYNQSLDFTCGPSSLMMAMKALDRRQAIDRKHELQLWREANTVYMGDGHPGSSPYGLALAAWRRGFVPELWLSHRGPFLLGYQRQKPLRAVSDLIQREDEKLVKASGIASRTRSWSVSDLAAQLAQERVPLVLVSTTLFHGDDGPHWVAVAGIDKEKLYINDPWITRSKRQTAKSQTGRAVGHADFMKMAAYDGERAVVLISN